MSRFFGRSQKNANAMTLDQACTKADGRVNDLNAKIAGIDNQLRTLKPMVAKNNPSAKQKATQLIKQKKMYEQQLNMLMSQQMNMEQMNFGIQSMQANKETFDSMKAANKQMKTQIKQMNIDKVESLMDDIQDNMYDMEDINEAMSRSYDIGDAVDETELEGELAALGDEVDFEDTSYLDTIPSVPSSQVQNAQPAQRSAVPALN